MGLCACVLCCKSLSGNAKELLSICNEFNSRNLNVERVLAKSDAITEAAVAVTVGELTQRRILEHTELLTDAFASADEFLEKIRAAGGHAGPGGRVKVGHNKDKDSNDDDKKEKEDLDDLKDAYSLVRREEELDADGTDGSHDDSPPVSWTPLQLWRTLDFITTSAHKVVPFSDLRDQIFDGYGEPIVDLISHDILGFELTERERGGGDREALWFISTASPCVGTAFEKMRSSPRWQSRMKELERSIQHEAMVRDIETDQAKISEHEHRIEVKNPANLIIQMRRSSDWGKTWGSALATPFIPPYLSQVVYDAKVDTLVGVGPCPGSKPPPSDGADAHAGLPFPCATKSTDEGTTWSSMVPTGKGNGIYGRGEGGGGIAMASTGNILSPFGVSNASDPKQPATNRVLISADHGGTWTVGGPTPLLVDGQPKPWGECMVAELANGSVVLTSRLGVAMNAASRWRAFTISHDGGTSWENAWTFPANQPFDVGFGPGYNCEHGLLSAHGKTKLLLSKPTATLHGDAHGAPHSRCSPGSCVYRRNLTISSSDNGGATWSMASWGLIYPGRVAYSDMAELPDGRIAVVFERGTAAGEYQYLSVAIVTPPWAASA